jgi:hypothetical protein
LPGLTSQPQTKDSEGMKNTIKPALALAFIVFTSCAPASRPTADKLADRTVKSLGCWSFKDEFYDGLYDLVQEKQTWPAVEDLSDALRLRIEKSESLHLDPPTQDEVIRRAENLYTLLTSEAIRDIAPQDHALILERLTGLELGDRTDQIKDELQNRLQLEFTTVEKLSEGANRNCGEPPKPEISPLAKKSELAILGARRAFSVSYQSCAPLSLPAMTKSTPNVKGIKITGDHPSGGKKRVISNLNDFVTSNYYLKAVTTTGAQCLNIKKNPMIYDFGGKPATSTAADAKLDFFKNAGSGTATLGIDCSGFVYSALANSGLKIKRDGRLKAISVNGISSTMFTNPKANGLDCMEPVKMTAALTIRSGDVLAQKGHVVMVDEVGADPFGVAAIAKVSDCTASKISTSRFNFTIMQSSPSKNGMGINRYRAADYVTENGTMSTGLKAYAVAACKARFSGPQSVSTVVTFVRHSDNVACFDQRVALQGEECVTSCTNLAQRLDD